MNQIKAAEAAESEARVSELEGKVSSLESENLEAVARMEEALSKEAAAEEMADKAVKMEEDTRTEMAVSGDFLRGCAVCLLTFFSSYKTKTSIDRSRIK